jgi:hypothetical protein
MKDSFLNLDMNIKTTHTLVLRKIAMTYRVKTMVALKKKESGKEFAVMRNFTRTLVQIGLRGRQPIYVRRTVVYRTRSRLP